MTDGQNNYKKPGIFFFALPCFVCEMAHTKQGGGGGGGALPTKNLEPHSGVLTLTLLHGHILKETAKKNTWPKRQVRWDKTLAESLFFLIGSIFVLFCASEM